MIDSLKILLPGKILNGFSRAYLLVSIVGSLLTGCASNQENADSILFNGKIVSVDEKFSIG